MDLDPHTLHTIVQRISQQMRCPQCGEQVPVEIESIRMTAEDFMLLQLQCAACDAYIVLHAALSGLKETASTPSAKGENASSAFTSDVQELEKMRNALQKAGGSFSSLLKMEVDMKQKNPS